MVKVYTAEVPELFDMLYDRYAEAGRLLLKSEPDSFERGFYKGKREAYDELLGELVQYVWDKQNGDYNG